MRKCKNPIFTFLEEKKDFDDEFMFCEFHSLEANFTNENTKFNECIFHSVTFNDCKAVKGDFLDIFFENCDCSNMDFSESTFHRIIFKNCRMIGTDFTNCVIKDAQFINDKMTMVNFSGSSLKNCLFQNSDCQQAGFVESKFKDCQLDKCNFTQAEFIHTPLAALDFSTSILEGISCTPDALSGIIVNPYQAIELSKLLGIVIKE